MLPIKLFLIFNIKYFCSCIKSSHAERRLISGIEEPGEKGYVVAIITAEKSRTEDRNWKCGGAIVTDTHIVTSAACLEDSQYMYAVAGTKTNPSNKSSDECYIQSKRKIIHTCVPKAYEFTYSAVGKWAYIDIAVAQVEKPWDFTLTLPGCQYKPSKITINYELKYQQAGIDAFVFGWGSEQKFRTPDKPDQISTQTLQFAPVLLSDKEVCKKAYSKYPKLLEAIDKYMVCTVDSGNINSAGELILTSRPLVTSCLPGGVLRSNGTCDYDALVYDGRRKILEYYGINVSQTRRTGICQNDHGGPLVTYVGGREVLIGVASVFLVRNDSTCSGPFLYTSTQCNSAFLSCVINTNSSRRSDLCERPVKERGYELIERRISWIGHPDGPAKNERVELRPQIPISNYG